MRHQLSQRALGRSMSHRRALLRGLVTSLVLKESIRTTVQKAKELRPLIEKYITLGRKDSVANRRLAAGFLFDKAAVAKLFTDLGPRFKNRNGGYTRIVRTDIRPGDTAQMAVIELVEKAALNASAAPTEEKAPKAEKSAKAPKAKSTKAKAKTAKAE